MGIASAVSVESGFLPQTIQHWSADTSCLGGRARYFTGSIVPFSSKTASRGYEFFNYKLSCFQRHLGSNAIISLILAFQLRTQPHRNGFTNAMTALINKLVYTIAIFGTRKRHLAGIIINHVYNHFAVSQLIRKVCFIELSEHVLQTKPSGGLELRY
jgi:hypothetical protein